MIKVRINPIQYGSIPAYIPFWTGLTLAVYGDPAGASQVIHRFWAQGTPELVYVFDCGIPAAMFTGLSMQAVDSLGE